MDYTIDNLQLAADVFSEVAYYYFKGLEEAGNGDMQVMVKVGETDVIIQMDRVQNKLRVTVPDTNFILPDDEIERAKFPVHALIQVATLYFKQGMEEHGHKGNGCVVVVDDRRYNVWLDEESGQIRFNMDAQDRDKE